MSRKMVDDVVLRKVKEVGDERELMYLQSPVYSVAVGEKIGSVSLESSALGIGRDVPLIEQFEKWYHFITIESDFGVIQYGNREFQVSCEELRTLKVFIVAHTSRCEPYAQVVASVAMQLLKQLIMQSSQEIHLVQSAQWSQMQQYVFQSAVAFIQSKVTKQVIVDDSVEV